MGERRAMVFGATGYTGREVVRLLVETGAQTVAHVRPGSSRGAEWAEVFREQGAEVVECPWEEGVLMEALREAEPEVVFFLVGTTKSADRRSEEDLSYEAIDYGLCRMLVDACVATGLGPRFVYLSAMGVREGSRSAYYQARYRAEEAVKESGLSYVIARPGMITGPDRDESRPMERAGGVVSDVIAGGLRLMGAGRLADRYGATDNTELATALVELGLGEGESQVVEAEDLKRH